MDWAMRKDSDLSIRWQRRGLRLLFSVLVGAIVLGSFPIFSGGQNSSPYPYRWFFATGTLLQDSDAERLKRLVRVAAAHGVDGMALSARLDRLDQQPRAYFRRLREVKNVCDSAGIEIIPVIFSAGYGGSVLAFNRNLAAGLRVENALFVAGDSLARFVPDRPVYFVNGNFESASGHRLRNFQLQDGPGRVSFIDRRIRKEGRASLRFERLGSSPHGHGRLMQKVRVIPRRNYRISFWLKQENLRPRSSFVIQIFAGNRMLTYLRPRILGTDEWQQIRFGFNSMGFREVSVYLGTWGARGGRFWLDGLQIDEVGLLNVLRRPGTPVTVRSEQNGVVYREGRDYAPIRDPHLDFFYDHEAPPIRLLPGSRIRPGERLRVSFYHGAVLKDTQVSVCMSEPEVYEIWRREARRLVEVLAPKRFLLSMDEIREGGSCAACQNSGLSMAQILGNCVTKQVQILRDLQPGAEVFIWSDMLDPYHNAHGDFFLVDGDFTGSWKFVPHDLVIVDWNYARREESLRHFSQNGFRVMAAAYYDSGSLDNPRDWLRALRKVPAAVGIMYTTWQRDYRLLPDFGDLVQSERR